MDVETKPLWTTTREAMGKTWTVRLAADDTMLDVKNGSHTEGQTQLLKQIITINGGIPCQERDDTLLHELLHCANHQTNLGLREDTVTRIALALYPFLRGFGLWRDFPWPDRDERPYLPGTEDMAQEASSSTVRPEQHAYYGGRPWGEPA